MKKISLFILFATISACAVAADEKPLSREVRAKYVSATVYTGMTVYTFTDEKTGNEIRVESPVEAKLVSAPKNLLESDKDLEGPPGANPAMVGKIFIIQYLEGGKIHIKKAVAAAKAKKRNGKKRNKE